jgi:hypothetical protein
MIVSCGDSFFYGSDLKDSDHAWPALIAQDLEHDYRCFAEPGVGNLRILQQIIQAQSIYGTQAIYAINWSWIDRFDYVSIKDDTWHTIRPSLDDSVYDDLYYKHFHSELADKFRNLVCVSQACDLLTGHQYVMTYMDPLMLDQQWHAPDYVQILQKKIQPYLNNFNGKTFLQWSRDNAFPESDRWHPLESAHRAAADYWTRKFQSL